MVTGSLRAKGWGAAESAGSSDLVAVLSKGGEVREAGSRVSSCPVLSESPRRGSLCLRDPSLLPLPPESASNDRTRGVTSASKALNGAAAAP